LWIENSYFLTAVDRPFNIVSANDIWIVNSAFDQSGSSPALTSVGLVWLIGNYFGAMSGTASGLYLSTVVNDLTMIGNYAYKNAGSGFYLSGTFTRATIVGNTAYDNGDKGWYLPGITLDGAIFQNNSAYNNTSQGFTFPAGSTATGVSLQGNVSYGNGGDDWGTVVAADIIRGNVGYTTENSGTATISSGSTNTTIAHGLAVTPTGADCSAWALEEPTNTVGTIWTGNFTATWFNVEVENDPGASGLDVGWQCTVY
jgi:parallel beta-helix repeat protein